MPSSATATAVCCLLALAALALPAAQAGGYADYLSGIEKRNQQLHADYQSGLGDGQRSFLDDLEGHVSDLQAKHYVRDSAYPGGFDSDRYWAELLERTAAADAAASGARETRGRAFPDAAADGLADAAAADPDRMASALLGGSASVLSDRRDEEPFLNRIWGEQKVSGGSGKPGQVTGPGNKPQKGKVITDRLPSYCDPPNPCPTGVDPKKLTSPCDRGVHDTAEYNRNDVLRKMASGQCPCDNEHMECPAGTVSVTSKKAARMGTHNNPYLRGNKRDKLAAKKSPALSAVKRGVHANFRSQVMEKKNPWLDGAEALDTVEKKAGQRLEMEEPLSE